MTHNLLTLPISEGGVFELHETICTAVRKGEKALIAHVNLHAFYLAQKNPWFSPFLRQARFVYCDGEAVRWAAKILGTPVPQKIGLTRWVWELSALCEREHLTLFLLGGRPGVAELAAQNLKNRHPNLKIAGTHEGYFNRQGPENERLLERLKHSRPDVIIIAFGMPLQEAWLRDCWPHFERGVFIPGGGVLDYVSGRLGKAPAWMIRCHLEWLFRVYQEPQRLLQRYLVEIPWFFMMLVKEKFKSVSVSTKSIV